MVNVEICIGSACYVKGSSQVVTAVKELLQKHSWEDKVNVKGSFCMKACQEKKGLGIKVNGRLIEGVTASNVSEVLEKEIAVALL
ncbi:MAG: (2Fe-2S) ferredoxin domain-containing protein [Solobacterium sp.]|nr:(2Fe-2S) ferredoxin domain-containing protein [Solobacterium sp.]